MTMLRLRKDAVLTVPAIKRIVEQHRTNVVPRLEKLERYYEGKNDILKRQMADETTPNNRVPHTFGNYITDTLVGYFIGKPVSYKSEDAAAMEEIQSIFNYNDEQDENAELASDASIYGAAYEMLYVDADGNIRFKNINPKEVICIYDNTVENELLYVIRYYDETDIITEEDYTTVEVYSRDNIATYQAGRILNDLTLIEEKPHYFGLVPFASYQNNSRQIGDYELVTPLIDEYDISVSDTLNNQEYTANSILLITGISTEPITELDDEGNEVVVYNPAQELKNMKEKRTMIFENEQAKAQFLNKDANDVEAEETKKRLEKDIHKMAKCPNLSDENFVGNSSGVAMAYKLMGTEDLTSIKERKFKKGLQRRIELIAAISNLKSAAFDWREIEIIFTRNIPVNKAELIDMAVKLKGIVSTETLLSQLGFIENVQLELEKLENEKQSNPFYNEMNIIADEAINQEEEVAENEQL